MIIRHAQAADLRAIEALRRADRDSLGFIPKERFEHLVNRTPDRGRSRWRYEWLLVSEDEREITGFCFALFSRFGVKIEQVCVRGDARRFERAMRLVDAMEHEGTRRGSPRVRCRVAYDIEANFFWKACGYTAVATTTSKWQTRASKSQRPLVVYDKLLDQLPLFPFTELQELLHDQ